jgi:hypothetical protein
MIASPPTTDGEIMSKQQLVSAYLHGDLGRRQFVRGLVALGVSLTAALGYAEMNAPAAHASGPQSCAKIPVTSPGYAEGCGA